MKSLVARKLAGLVDVVDDLRQQLRLAVATELSKAIANTVREVLEVLIASRELPRRVLPTWEQPVGDYGRTSKNFDDWDDPWKTPRPVEPDEDDDESTVSDSSDTPMARTNVLQPSTISLAVNAGHWIFRLSRSWLCGLGGSLAVALAAGYGGTVTRSVLTVAAAVHQLAGHADPSSQVTR